MKEETYYFNKGSAINGLNNVGYVFKVKQLLLFPIVVCLSSIRHSSEFPNDFISDAAGPLVIKFIAESSVEFG